MFHLIALEKKEGSKRPFLPPAFFAKDAESFEAVGLGFDARLVGQNCYLSGFLLIRQ